MCYLLILLKCIQALRIHKSVTQLKKNSYIIDQSRNVKLPHVDMDMDM